MKKYKFDEADQFICGVIAIAAAWALYYAIAFFA